MSAFTYDSITTSESGESLVLISRLDSRPSGFSYLIKCSYKNRHVWSLFENCLEKDVSQIGRPELPDEFRRDNVLRIRLAQDERVLLDRAANDKTSTWARDVLLKAAKRAVKD